MRLRAAFLTLWQRASDMPITGRPSLRDGGGACVVKAMRGMNALSAYHGHAERLKRSKKRLGDDLVASTLVGVLSKMVMRVLGATPPYFPLCFPRISIFS